MKELTEKQREELKIVEHHLQTARVGVIRNLSRKELDTVNKIYTELGYGKVNLSCPKCVFKVCKTLSDLYFTQ